MNKRFTIMVVILVVMTGRMLGDASTYLNFTAVNGPGSVELRGSGTPHPIYIQYSTDSCLTWNELGNGWNGMPSIINLSSGETVYLKASALNSNYNYDDNYYYFVMSGSISADGNIMSLLDSTMQQTSVSTKAFYYLFKDCISLTTAPELPATTLADSCYKSMFEGCTSLTVAPALPATTLTNSCYWGMFEGCSSLTTAPVLPATTMADNCYSFMFYQCSSLKLPPALPAMTLANNCYAWMFCGCGALAYVPNLPAMVLADFCYYNMFWWCVSLKSVPTLPATTLAVGCYCNMFQDCKSIKTIPDLPATTLTKNCYSCMFAYCDSLGINKQGPGKPWQIPSNAIPAENWNAGMFIGVGWFYYTGNPEIGVTYYITSDTTASDVENVIDEPNITIYPNPVHIGETVLVSADEDLSMVEVYDVDGVCVHRFESPERTIEIKGLNSAGVYIVRITNKNNRVTTRKLIVY